MLVYAIIAAQWSLVCSECCVRPGWTACCRVTGMTLPTLLFTVPSEPWQVLSSSLIFIWERGRGVMWPSIDWGIREMESVYQEFCFSGTHWWLTGTAGQCVRIWPVRLLSKTRLVCGRLSPWGLRSFWSGELHMTSRHIQPQASLNQWHLLLLARYLTSWYLPTHVNACLPFPFKCSNRVITLNVFLWYTGNK